MRKTLLSALALALVTAAAPASAADDSQWFGDCGYDTLADPTWQVGDPDRYHGVVYGYAVVYSPSSPDPVSATITCTLSVEGEPVGAMTATGTTVVAGAGPLDFVVRPDQWVEVCLSIDFADDTPSESSCSVAIPYLIPPQELFDAVDSAIDLVPGLHDTVCTALRSGAVPDLGRVLSTGDDGDLYVADRKTVDCP